MRSKDDIKKLSLNVKSPGVKYVDIKFCKILLKIDSKVSCKFIIIFII